MIICKHIVEIIWLLIVHICNPKFLALNLKFILYFQQMQLFKKWFRMCIIPAVCHNPKGTFFAVLDMRSQSKPHFVIPNRRCKRLNESCINSIAERRRYRLSLFITPSMRDILLAIVLCVSSNSFAVNPRNLSSVPVQSRCCLSKDVEYHFML